MKHLKLWESHQTELEIAAICKQYRIENWSLNKDGLVDVDGNVDLNTQVLTRLPLKFGEVKGAFELYGCKKLESLEGSPYKVGSWFYCFTNKLKTLVGGPQIVLGSYFCSNNELTTLQGAPHEVGGGFFCTYNNLTSLEGGPKIVNGDFECKNNDKLTSLQGLPRIINSKPAEEWIINKINDITDGQSSDLPGCPVKWGQKLLDLLHTIPDYALTPKLLDFVRSRYPEKYNLLRQRRSEDQRWKTDLSADLGDLGF